MRIGIDIRCIGRRSTGDEVYLYSLLERLARFDSTNEYLLFTDRSPEDDADLRRRLLDLALSPRFHVVPVLPAHKLLWTFFSLPRALRAHPVDVLHVQYITPLWLPRGTRLITTIHDVSFARYPEMIARKDLLALRSLIPLAVRRADRVLTVSGHAREEITRCYRVPPEKVTCIYNGVDGERFAARWTPERLEVLRAKYHLPERFLLYVGTLQPRKNVPALVDALAILHRQHGLAAVKLVVAGNRGGRNTDPGIDAAVARHGLGQSVLFPGWVADEDLPGLYQLAECFVFPSLYEGFGFPPLEAMAAGTPVVCSNRSSLPEVCGDGAVLVDPETPEALAEGIRGVLTDAARREALIRRGRENVRRFTWEKAARALLEVYRQVGGR